MALKTMAAQLPARELLLAAQELDMVGCSKAEVAKAVLICTLDNCSPDEARERVLGKRNVPSRDKEKTIFSVGVPVEWHEKARREFPDLTLSQFFRYCFYRVTEGDDDAIARAVSPKAGRPRRHSTA
jgi:hypothetical protein